MATVLDTPPSACQVLADIAAARRELDHWESHVAAFRDGRQPGQALAARRSARVVTSALAAAACDTTALARDAQLDAFLLDM